MMLHFKCANCGRKMTIHYEVDPPIITPNKLPSIIDSTWYRLDSCWCASDDFELRLSAHNELKVDYMGPMIRLGKIVDHAVNEPAEIMITSEPINDTINESIEDEG